MLLAIAVTLALLCPPGLPLTPLFLTAILSLIFAFDDRANLPVVLRFVVQLLAAAIIVVSWLHSKSDMSVSLVHDPKSFLESLFTSLAVIFAICWMANLFNFMDGADGMAGGMAFFGFGGFALAAATSTTQIANIAAVSAAVSGAAIGFLAFNFPAARVFMGDAGSVPIGFLAAVLNFQAWITGQWPWWFGILVFSPFIVDATVTLIKRMLKQEKLWVAHREHYYQRLILSGWSHRKTAVSYYILMLGSTLSALAAQNSQFLYPIAGFWVITYASLLLYLEWLFRKYKKVN